MTAVSTAAIIVVVIAAFIIFKKGHKRAHNGNSANNHSERLPDQLPAPSEQVLALINQRHNLEALKLYMSEANATMLEAKRVIDHHTVVRRDDPFI